MYVLMCACRPPCLVGRHLCRREKAGRGEGRSDRGSDVDRMGIAPLPWQMRMPPAANANASRGGSCKPQSSSKRSRGDAADASRTSTVRLLPRALASEAAGSSSSGTREKTTKVPMGSHKKPITWGGAKGGARRGGRWGGRGLWGGEELRGRGRESEGRGEGGARDGARDRGDLIFILGGGRGQGVGVGRGETGGRGKRHAAHVVVH